MNAKRIISGIATVTWLTVGCASTVHRQPIGYAEPVGDWGGISHVARDGNVYFAGQPTRDALLEAKRRGVTTVVNLRTDEEMTSRIDFDEPALVEELGMTYVSIPVTSQSLSVAEVGRLQDVLNETTGPVLIHCGSSNRVGALWALYLHRHRGFSLDEALERGRNAGLRSEVLIQAIRRVSSEGSGDQPN